MPDLPGRPDLDQLRRQGRELARAAADGDPSAVARLHAVSQRISLSAAQLALAREYGFPSWQALRTEAERRRSAEPPGAFEDRWSFGGAAAIETVAGVLHPAGLIASPDHAVLDMTLLPPDEPRDEFATPPLSPDDRKTWALAAHDGLGARAYSVLSEVTVVDERGTSSTLQPAGISGPSGPDRGPISMRLRLDPVPSRESGWVELRGRDGAATRLMPSARPAVRVSQKAHVPHSPAEQELSNRAFGILHALLAGTSQDAVERACSAALRRAAQMRQAGELDPVSDIPRHLAQLCAALTGHEQPAGIPRGWSSMISAAGRADGAPHHLDLATDLPRVGNTAVRVDSLISAPGSWRVHLRARPGWWIYNDERNRKWAAMSVDAEDDLGGMYLTEFGGSTGRGDHEELSLRFLPRLDPAARSLRLMFTAAGKQVALELHL